MHAKGKPAVRKSGSFPGFGDLREHRTHQSIPTGGISFRTYVKTGKDKRMHHVTGIFAEDGSPLARLDFKPDGTEHAVVHPDAPGKFLINHSDAHTIPPGHEVVIPTSGSEDAVKEHALRFSQSEHGSGRKDLYFDFDTVRRDKETGMTISEGFPPLAERAKNYAWIRA